MDSTNPVTEERMVVNKKVKPLLFVKPVTDELWTNHLGGEGPALGIIPITENNDCRWGCIDIDEYDLDHVSLIKSIRNLKLPVVLCRSKSGGAHVFLFTKENIPASLMQSKLKQMALSYWVMRGQKYFQNKQKF